MRKIVYLVPWWISRICISLLLRTASHMYVTYLQRYGCTIALFHGYYLCLRDQPAFDAMRPCCLQATVLLLAMVTDRELEELKDFMQCTYSLKIDRFNLEMLILKALPLISSNSEVFMKGLESTFNGLTELLFSS